MQNLQNVIAAIILGVCLILASFVYVTGLSQNVEKTIQVVGEGKAKVVPSDVGGSVNAEIKSANKEDAYKMMNDKIDQVKSILIQAGLTENDIKTESLNVGENYVYPNGEMKQEGFVASQRVSFKTKNVDTANTILDRLAAVDNLSVSGVEFNPSESEEITAKDNARNLALEDAKVKARQIANQMGARIVGIKSVGSAEQTQNPVFRNYAMSDLGAETTNLSPGEQEVVQNVNVVFLVK